MFYLNESVLEIVVDDHWSGQLTDEEHVYFMADFKIHSWKSIYLNMSRVKLWYIKLNGYIYRENDVINLRQRIEINWNWLYKIDY